MRATRAKVEAALKAEAKKLNAAHSGSHHFSEIWQEPGACPNWSASFQSRGSKADLNLMRAALMRVQAKYPMVDWSEA